ncbi:ER-golgi trafficking TRAPP I complex 85 kDa subunit-domain-containing protein [Aspergillus unguis]
MTSPGDAAPVKPPPSFSPGVSRVSSTSRYSSQRRDSSASLDTEKPDPRIASNTTTPLPTTPSELPIRSASPHARSVRSSTPQPGRNSLGSPLEGRADAALDTRSLIIRAFSPVIGVYASPDTDELVRQKGFTNGFWELIRPFGENVPGKLVVRDSVGSSRGWEDYGVRFADLGEICRAPHDSQSRISPLSQVEKVLQKQLDSIGGSLNGSTHPEDLIGLSSTSPLYKQYLRQLLSIASDSPHETFRHPVASVIAISSRNSDPLESLRQLYADTNTGQRKVPDWIHPEYLRYYVLVHDEDRDDITASTKLYDQMKRHFGLHCHLLRLRSNQCVVTDDDSVQIPECEWLSPSERLSERTEPLVDLDSDGQLYLFESDVMAIKAFVRELVAQSVVPFMENRVAVWNDQVASRRRGISGRFMSMSRKWAGFGSGSRSSGSGGGASGNYNVSQGFYHFDHSEAILRKMADYAFMLRDWKLAASTYELLRSDYANDKAWKYHAGAYEMSAVSTLLNPLGIGSKTKVEGIDQMIDTACYSYLTRCSDAPTTLRCLTLAVELLRSRGGSAAESAAKWAMRAMDLGLLESVGQVLFSERISSCYASRAAPNGVRFGARLRKAGMWSLFAADMWLKLGKPSLASACLEEAERLYVDTLGSDGVFPMPEMQTFVDNLRLSVKIGYLEARGLDVREETGSTDPLDNEETSEKLDRRMNRRSLIGNLNPLDTATLASLQTAKDGDILPSDDFERA